jgi:hypothetical protein
LVELHCKQAKSLIFTVGSKPPVPGTINLVFGGSGMAVKGGLEMKEKRRDRKEQDGLDCDDTKWERLNTCLLVQI